MGHGSIGLKLLLIGEVKNFNGMQNTGSGSFVELSAELGQATDVARGHQLGPGIEDVLDLALSQLISGLWLVDVVGASGTATDFSILHLHNLDIWNFLENASGRVRDTLGMKKVAGILIGKLYGSGRWRRWFDSELVQKDRDILHAFNKGLRLLLLGFTL